MTKRAFTLIELLVVISIIALLIGILLPAIGKARDSAKVTISLSNLRNFGAAHATYASEWDGRQWTTCPDDLTQLLGINFGMPGAFPNPPVPPVPLGFDKNGTHWQTSQGWAIVPFWFTGNCSLGSFRAFHTKPFNAYINKKVYDPIFWAPKDYTIEDKIFQWQDDPGEWVSGASFYFSSYCSAVSAQVSPDVFRGPASTDYKTPRGMLGGFRSPNLSTATYPDLKTHMLEHYWLQQNPSESIPGTAGVPWFYNMGPDSTPATLFFDGHTRMMSVREAVSSSRRVVTQGELPLDAREFDCFGSGGYFQTYGYAGSNGRGEINSYHIFTRDGIKGRDTTGSP